MTYSRDIAAWNDVAPLTASATNPAIPVIAEKVTKGSNKKTVATWMLLDALLALGESDPIALALINDIDIAIAALQTQNTTLVADLATLKSNLSGVDTSRASQAALDALAARVAELETAITALPSTGATPQQLEDINQRIAAVEQAVSAADSSKGIMVQNVRSHFLVAGNLFGGVRRLVSTDIEGLNERSGIESTSPYRALNGTGQTGLENASNQWLTWYFLNTLRLWRIEITQINNNWANRDLKRNGVKILDLYNSSGTYTSIYTPDTTTKNEATNSLQFIDDGGNTVISNLYASISDSADPSPFPTLPNGYTLKIGDRFRFNSGTTSILYEFMGTDGLSGAWWAKPVQSVTDSNIALYSVINPIFDSLQSAISALENKAANGDRFRRESYFPTDINADGSWDWWLGIESGVTSDLVRLFVWLRNRDYGLVAEKSIPKAAPTHTTATSTGANTWTNTLPSNLTINYSTTLDNQNNAQFSATFPADSITRFRFDGKDAGGTTLEIGQGDPASGTTAFTLNPFLGNASVVVVVWTITYSNGTIVNYEVPITR